MSSPKAFGDFNCFVCLFDFYNHVIPSGLRNTNPEGMELL